MQIVPVSVFIKWIVHQSDPLADKPNAYMLPSSLNLLIVIAMVPSSDKVFGSKNTLGSLSNVSCT